MISFRDLKRDHRNVYDVLMDQHEFDATAAEENWLDLLHEATVEGQAIERARCVGHVELALTAGDVSLAIAPILQGASVESMQQSYLAAAQNGLRGRLMIAHIARKDCS